VKRIAFVLLLLCACGREERPERPRRITFPLNPPVTPSSRKAPDRGITPSATSTPSRCAGNGSYEQGLDCFRMTTGFHFRLDGLRGEMTRPTPGLERVQFKSWEGDTWIGEAKHQGVVWTRNGVREQSPPAFADYAWQRTTMVLDPQKKEGAPQFVGADPTAGGLARHYHFTNANNGEENDVWVSATDGRIVKWKKGSSMLELR
jgi:hypothetical protein